jgi:Flp pilus assembly protein TadG
MKRFFDLWGDEEGAALIEFCIVMPALLMMFSGTLQYSYWFYISNSIQATANDAARASLPGLSASERASLATATVNKDLANIGGLNASAATIQITDNGQNFEISIAYDEAKAGLANLGLVPMPSTTLTRSALVALNTY